MEKIKIIEYLNTYLNPVNTWQKYVISRKDKVLKLVPEQFENLNLGTSYSRNNKKSCQRLPILPLPGAGVFTVGLFIIRKKSISLVLLNSEEKKQSTKVFDRAIIIIIIHKKEKD